jgi:glycosyltransferase involved in cell wall biosynthesis
LQPHISIVLPCFNPTSGWEKRIIESVHEIRQMIEGEVEIIIVNDGSVSGISEKGVEYLKTHTKNLHYFSYTQNQGKGYAVRFGMSKASHSNVIFTDIDFPYQSSGLVKMAEMLSDGKADVVVGARNSNYYDGIPLHRKIISKTLIAFNKLLLGLPTGETQAGLKGFSKEGKKALLDSTINGYLFDIEVLKIAHKRGLAIKTCPVELRKDIHFSTMKFSLLLRELANYLKILFKRYR